MEATNILYDDLVGLLRFPLQSLRNEGSSRRTFGTRDCHLLATDFCGVLFASDMVIWPLSFKC